MNILKRINTRVFLSGVTIVASGALIAFATFAFFSDTETSADNTFEAGVLDLQIDNTSYYNGVFNEGTSWLQPKDLINELFFSFDDVKPGDYGEDTISIHIDDNDSYVCADVTLTSNNDNGLVEPEEDNGDATGGAGEGELADEIEFIWWADDGDNVLEVGEDVLPGGPLGVLGVGGSVTVQLADFEENIWGEEFFPGGETRYIGKAWCFGEIALDPEVQDGPVQLGQNGQPTNGPDTRTAGFVCDGSSEDNITQSDSVTADITFTTVQVRNNPDFVCGDEPILVSCAENDIQYANGSSDEDQGLRKDGVAVLPNRSIPGAAFGEPETFGDDSDVGFPAGSFYSLGFPNVNASTATASIVFSFDDPFYPNPSGPDLQIFEVTGGVYPDEQVKVEVSPDGTNWTLAAASATRDVEIELPIPFAQFVKLTDVSNINLFPNDADGYDVDGLKTFCRVSEGNQ